MPARPALVARLDSDGDVLLAGPAVRAVAANASEVILLVGPRGRQAAELLPGVDDIICWAAPWIEPSRPQVKRDRIEDLIGAVRRRGVTDAVILTSFHQCPLPLALLLRLAEVERIAALSEDYPGSLLDVRYRETGDIPEVERALGTASAAGYRLPGDDAGRPAVRHPLPNVDELVPASRFVVVHPGTSAPARAWPPEHWTASVRLLQHRRHQVVVTGSPTERTLTRSVAVAGAVNLGGATTFAQLAAVFQRAEVVAVANTGPAHLAAAVGTPVVSLFAPTVPAARWAPYGVPSVLLGNQGAPCAGSRATTCPIPGHPCLASVPATAVADAVEHLRKEWTCVS